MVVENFCTTERFHLLKRCPYRTTKQTPLPVSLRYFYFRHFSVHKYFFNIRPFGVQKYFFLQKREQRYKIKNKCSKKPLLALPIPALSLSLVTYETYEHCSQYIHNIHYIQIHIITVLNLKIVLKRLSKYIKKRLK